MDPSWWFSTWQGLGWDLRGFENGQILVVTVLGRGFTPNLLFCDVYSDFRKRSGGMILEESCLFFAICDIQQKSACMIYACM